MVRATKKGRWGPLCVSLPSSGSSRTEGRPKAALSQSPGEVLPDPIPGHSSCLECRHRRDHVTLVFTYFLAVWNSTALNWPFTTTFALCLLGRYSAPRHSNCGPRRDGLWAVPPQAETRAPGLGDAGHLLSLRWVPFPLPVPLSGSPAQCYGDTPAPSRTSRRERPVHIALGCWFVRREGQCRGRGSWPPVSSTATAWKRLVTTADSWGTWPHCARAGS